MNVERRLTAILAADVAGYSRLVGADDAGTLVQWKAHSNALIEPKAKEHRGRIVRVLGDSILIEFGSVIDAMRCAIDVQRGMAERNTDLPLDRRLEFRMGINFGELIIESGDFWGDGVNIAARLEALAEPGGICISGRVHEDVYGKIDVSFEDTGEQRLKNIARPVRVYRVRFEQPGNSPVPLTLPDKPSIAALPFHVLSADPEQEHFADGMMEEITTALSRIRQFFVIARNSTLSYKGRAVDVKQVSGELGVRYVLQGSVRKASGRVRVTVQLVDAVTAHHIWAERYDREFADIFALQDEITERIVAAIEPQLYGAEFSRTKRKPPESLDAWECVMRGLSYVNNRSIHDYAAAKHLLKRATEIDPTYAQAHALTAYLTALEVLYGWTPEERALPLAWDAAQKALLLDPDDPWVHLALGYVHQQCRRSQDAVQEYENALFLNPNFALAHTYMAAALSFLGRIDDAFVHIATSERLSPRGLFHGVNNLMRAVAHFFAGEHREAVVFARKSVLESPGIVTAYRHLVVNCALVGELDEARAALNILKRLQPEISVAWIEKWLPYRSANDRRKFIEAFRLAGLE
jgi:adenylate cyclase